jgi:NAD(P) transhydrogenase subunit alpha
VTIGIPREVAPGETRVALTPPVVQQLIKNKHQVIVEHDAGRAASFSDEQYHQAGASIVTDTLALYESSDLICKVQPPQMHPALKKHEAELLREGSALMGFLSPLTNKDAVKIFVQRKVTSFSLEFVPRITPAQSMDALSSMATVAGYKSVLLAADRLPKMFPLLMTAAGTVPPAIVLILGAGVAGLQAIATAKRLGARVEAFDPRPAVKEQVKSLGAAFVEMEIKENVETAGGYAREQSEEFLKMEQEVIGNRLKRIDVVICTAQIFGKKAPVLITTEMVKLMHPGSMIIDLAAEQGGNCELTEAGKTIQHNGVAIVGAVNLPALLPVDSSQMFSKNVVNLFLNTFDTDGNIRFDDEVTKGCCITHNGEILNPMVKAAVQS